MTKKLLLAELDARLTEAAQTPDTYDRVMGEYAVQCDCNELELELLDPIQWRRSADRVTLSRSNSLEQLFRADVAAILPLDKEEETALARRIEFARVRLESALERAGVDFEELSPDNVDVESVPLPSEALVRWREWHALRKEMVERNLFLVLLNLERYAHTRASRMDLIQEGASALRLEDVEDLRNVSRLHAFEQRCGVGDLAFSEVLRHLDEPG